MPLIIVTGCERAGTTIVGKELARQYEVPYVHEVFTHKEYAVMKHSLNLQQHIKHLELLDYLYPEAEWYYVLRNPLENIRSLHQKIWQRHPHTISLDTCIAQYLQVRSAYDKLYERLDFDLVAYEDPKRYGFTYTPRSQVDYFTHEQKAYISERL